MSEKRGLFLSFEGNGRQREIDTDETAGRTFAGYGRTVDENQEPGATAIGKQIRRMLLDPVNSEMAAMTELLLMFASRAQAASEIIEPALERGEIVISDRFTDSTLAYQGFASGAGLRNCSRSAQI